ncbi:hypothetical protein GOP47_0020399 [Adiantum capillus-veneris]|uniref:Uncharacterized protein n=1 Tax=Adiantum capillus-veneris TaxID=13818 RepID=A0A9D4UD37_ADICA|nr:hypothetical protein GOP47_0019993 [Adiantum capillus-veneris]KAI5065704.1 hypothetical protein GOP47_0020399 [Adiantum capillus-veneris]
MAAYVKPESSSRASSSFSSLQLLVTPLTIRALRSKAPHATASPSSCNMRRAAMSRIDANNAVAKARRLGKFYVRRETNEKHTTSGDNKDIESAKRALRSFNPSLPHNSKLAHVFIAGYMECKKGMKEDQPLDEVDLVTPPHVQRHEEGPHIPEDVLHEVAADMNALEEVDNSIDVEDEGPIIAHHVVAGPSKGKRPRRKVQRTMLLLPDDPQD